VKQGKSAKHYRTGDSHAGVPPLVLPPTFTENHLIRCDIEADHYNHYATHRYPQSVTKLITGLCIALLLAAFTPSAIRLYVIGSSTFGAAVPYELAKHAERRCRG